VKISREGGEFKLLTVPMKMIQVLQILHANNIKDYMYWILQFFDYENLDFSTSFRLKICSKNINCSYQMGLYAYYDIEN
jgi:hypothetical protein